MTFLEHIARAEAAFGRAVTTREIIQQTGFPRGTVEHWISRSRAEGWLHTTKHATQAHEHTLTDAGRAHLAEFPPLPPEPLTSEERARLASITETTLITHRGDTRAVRGWALIACVHPRELVRRLREGQTLAEAVEPRQPIPDPRPEPMVERALSGTAERRVGDPHYDLWAPDDAHLRGRIFDELTLDEDELTRLFMAEHPSGATLEEVGDFLGLTRERVRQIEGAALQALRRRVHLAGLTEYAEDAA